MNGTIYITMHVVSRKTCLPKSSINSNKASPFDKNMFPVYFLERAIFKNRETL